MEWTEVVDTAGEVPFTAPMGLDLILCRNAEKVKVVEFEVSSICNKVIE